MSASAARTRCMRILHTEWSDGMGGQELRVLTELEGMIGRGHKVFLATRPECQIGLAAKNRGIPIISLAMRNSFDPASILNLRRWLKREKIDVLSTHSGIDSWIGGLAARVAGTRVLVRTRHLNIPLKRSPLNFVHYLPDRIVTCGEAIRQDLIERDGFPREKLVNIPTGIDFSRFKPARKRESIRASLGLADSAFMIFMVGILRGVKAHPIAFRAVQSLSAEFPNVALVLAGDGPGHDYLRGLAAELGIQDRVHLLGFRNDIPDLMDAADMLLLTSKSEGVPQSITQALGLGLPVVATNVGGVPELIQHERTGLLIPPNDPAAAAEAIRRVVLEPGKAREFACSGKALVLANFTLGAMLDKTEALYADLMK